MIADIQEIQPYLRDLSGMARTTPAPDGGDFAREQLVLGHLPRVVRIAFDYQGFGLPLGDLINEGNIGLMRAAELFDPMRNVRFSYYAKPWIRMQMRRALSYQAWPVSLPADLTWRRDRVQRTEERLAATLQRQPDDAEVVKESGMELPTVRRLRATPPPAFIPLDSAWPGEEADLTLAEVIPDENLPAPDCEAARHSDREFVDHMLATLTPGEQRVLRLRFGLDDGCVRTCQEVGQLLGYGRQNIHRIESAALDKLRRHARFLGKTEGFESESGAPRTKLRRPARSK
jgi:RNA polymerase primary sigma factor